MITGEITDILVTFDGLTWHELPVEIALPQRLAVRVYFKIETPDTARVKSILTFAYGDQVTPFESQEGGVTTGTYYYDFSFDFASGLPIGEYLLKAEVLYWDGEWKTLDEWSGKFADVTYRLLGKLTALGRKINEELSPFPFSVAAGSPFTLGINGYLQTPQAGQMKVSLDVFTPDGAVLSRQETLDITEPQAMNWSATIDFEGLTAAGIYTARMSLSFDDTLLDSFEGRIFEVTTAPAASPIGAITGAVIAAGALAGLGTVAKTMTAQK